MAMLLESLAFLFECFALAMECGKNGKWQEKWNESIFCVWILISLSLSISPSLSSFSSSMKSSKAEATSCIPQTRNSIKSLDEQFEMFHSFIFNFSPIKILCIVWHIIKKEIHIAVRLNAFVTIRFTIHLSILSPEKRSDEENSARYRSYCNKLQLERKKVIFHRSFILNDICWLL